MAQLTPSEIDVLIGKRIQFKRKACGFSAEKLSEMLNISQQQLSRYERGTNKINVAHLVNLANFLQTPISYFFHDCFEQSAWNTDELDVYWQTLPLYQKQLLAELIQSFKNSEK